MRNSHSLLVVSLTSAVAASTLAAPAAQAVTFAPSADKDVCVVTANSREQALFDLDSATNAVSKGSIAEQIKQLEAKVIEATSKAFDHREYMDQVGSSEKPDRYKDVYFYEEEAAQYKHAIAGYTACLEGKSYDSESIQGSSNELSSIYEVDSKDFFIGLSSDVAPESKIALGVVTGLVVLAGILAATAPMLMKYLPANITALLP